MRCAIHGVLAALLLACVAPRSSALRLEPTGVSSAASPRNSHEKLEQLFVVTASEFPGEAVTSISTSAAHQVYVSYSEAQSPGRLATVRVIGDRAQSIQSATVSATDGKPGHLRISSDVDSSSLSYLRMEIQVHSVQQLQHIEIISSGDIVVEAPELFVSSPQAKLVIGVSGSGDVYLPPELRILVQSLEIESASSGSIYVPASDITATNVQVTTTGSGDVKFGVSRQFNVASHVSIDSKSSGSCRVVVADFNTPQLEISTTGSGDVTVERVDGLNASSTTSLVGQCEYSVTGHGELNAGGVLCSSAVATVVGSGDIILQAKDSLTYQITGYADIRYVGSAPQSIVSSTGKLKSGAVKAVKDTPGSKPAWMDSYSLPPRRCSFVIGGDGYENIIESGEDGEDDDDKDDDETSPPSPVRGPTSVPDSTKAASSPSIHTRSWMPVLVIVLVVFIVWDRVKAWKRKSKRSGEKAPLLGSEAPVYI